MKIKISAVNELASLVFSLSFHERRDLILLWLNRQGISVYGRRNDYIIGDYDKLKKKMEKIWKDS